MLSRLKNWLKPSPEPEINQETVGLTELEVKQLTKGLQFYIFTRHKKLNQFPLELAERLEHAGHVAYSLIITFLREREFKMEYMSYINDELKTLYQLADSQRQYLDIQPEEIDQIELQDQLSLKFQDEDADGWYRLDFDREQHSVTISRYL
jgi:hypothetical protein